MEDHYVQVKRTGLTAEPCTTPTFSAPLMEPGRIRKDPECFDEKQSAQSSSRNGLVD